MRRLLGSAIGLVALTATVMWGCTPQKEYAINAPSTNGPSSDGSSGVRSGEGSGTAPEARSSRPGNESGGPGNAPPSVGGPQNAPGGPGAPGTSPNPGPQANGQGAPGGGGQGQQGRGSGMGRGGALGLLRNPDVQTELKLSDDQKKKLESVSESMRSQGGSQGDRPDPQAMAERMKKIETEVNGILKPDQTKRLEELRLQREGAAAFMRPEVAKELGLTEAQKKQIEDVQRKMMEKARSAMGGGPGGSPPGGGAPGQGGQPPAAGRNPGQGGAPPSTGAPGQGGRGGGQNFEEFRKMREEANAKIVGVLTPAQKTKWQSMQGKHFEFRQGGGQGGRGGGGNSRFGA